MRLEARAVLRLHLYVGSNERTPRGDLQALKQGLATFRTSEEYKIVYEPWRSTTSMLRKPLIVRHKVCDFYHSEVTIMSSEDARTWRLVFIIFITTAFLVVEIGVGVHTHSLALTADAFHYLSDLGGYIVAYVAYKLTKRPTTPTQLTYGWGRAHVIGSFVNVVALAALGFSIFIQSIQRFVLPKEVQQPMLVMIVGCIGLALNVVSLAFFHDFKHGIKPDEDKKDHCGNLGETYNGNIANAPPSAIAAHEVGLSRTSEMEASRHRHKDTHGFQALFSHALGDAAANIGVIAAALVIWKTNSPHRFYADPALSLAISILIMTMAVPLMKKNGILLAQSTPDDFDHDRLTREIEAIPGVEGIRDLRVWRLNEDDVVGSIQVNVGPAGAALATLQAIRRCFHGHGVDYLTVEACQNVGTRGKGR